MGEWFGELGKPGWWTSALVTILLVWLAEFLRRRIGGLLAKAIAAWNSRTAAKRADWDRLVAAAADQEHYWTHIQQNEIRLRISAAGYLVTIIGFTILVVLLRIGDGPMALRYLLAVATGLFSFNLIRTLIKAQTAKQVITEAFKKKYGIVKK